MHNFFCTDENNNNNNNKGNSNTNSNNGCYMFVGNNSFTII